jgi:hypothetical protein
MIKGVGADAPIVTNEKGGQQSKAQYAFHMLDTDSMLDMAETFAYGAQRYARDNWRLIPAEEHFNHMLIHYYAWRKGDKTDNHLAHFISRAMMTHACARAEDKEVDKMLRTMMAYGANDREADALPQIVAVDFDGCLCSNKWPEIGEPNTALIQRLIRHRENGGEVILWTCREGRSLDAAVDWCAQRGLTFDAVNANLESQNELFGNDCRKIGADLYIDDKAMKVEAQRKG